MFYKKKTDYLKIISVVQFIGAILGVLGILSVDEFLFEYYIFIILIILSLYSAYLLWIDDENGVLATKFNYILQVTDFTTPNFLDYQYNLCLYFNIGFDSRDLEALTLFGVETQFSFLSGGSDYFSFSINIIALGVLYMLFIPEKKWPKEDPFELGKWD